MGVRVEGDQSRNTSVFGDLSLLLARQEGHVHTLAPCTTVPAMLFPWATTVSFLTSWWGKSVDGRPRDLVLYCNHCGRGDGDVPCISVKYLIYLNINKIKLFVKCPVLCSCSGLRVGSEWEAASCLRAWWTFPVYSQRASSAFLPAKVKLQCLQRV